MTSRYQRIRLPAACGLAVLSMTLLWGCAPAESLTYSSRADIKGQPVEIPARHREQIAKYLDQYFGSPLSPRLMAPASPLSVESSGDTDGGVDAGGGGGPSASKPILKLVDHVDRQLLKRGADVYRQQCAGCHGVTGDGQGPAARYLNPLPRDYRLGRFKFASTPRGMKPRHEDLERIIRRGAKGTSMPAFRWMSDDDMVAVIEHVKQLSVRGELELLLIYDSQQEPMDEADDYDSAAVGGHCQSILASWDAARTQIILPLTVRPPYDDQSIRLGAQAFVKLDCVKCHGPDGRGNKKFNVGPDDWGRIAFAADLTTGMLHGGRRPVDIYRRIYSGINATPMPAFNNPNSAVGETADQRSETIWHMVHFVTSIVEGKPLPTDVIDEALQKTPAATGASPGSVIPSTTNSKES